MQVPAANVPRKCVVIGVKENIQNNAAEPKTIRGNCAQELVLRLHSSVGHASQRTEVNHKQTHHKLSTQNPIHCSRSEIGSENEVGTHRRNLSDRISEDWAVHTHKSTQPAIFTLLSVCREDFKLSSEFRARIVGTPAMVDVRKAKSD